MRSQAMHTGASNLPRNINLVTPVPRQDAKTITALVKKDGKIEGYQLSDGSVLSKAEGVALAKQGGIRGVAVAVRHHTEYLRALPDGSDANNLSDLPSVGCLQGQENPVDYTN